MTTMIESRNKGWTLTETTPWVLSLAKLVVRDRAERGKEWSLQRAVAHIKQMILARRCPASEHEVQEIREQYYDRNLFHVARRAAEQAKTARTRWMPCDCQTREVSPYEWEDAKPCGCEPVRPGDTQGGIPPQGIIHFTAVELIEREARSYDLWRNNLGDTIAARLRRLAHEVEATNAVDEHTITDRLNMLEREYLWE